MQPYKFSENKTGNEYVDYLQNGGFCCPSESVVCTFFHVYPVTGNQHFESKFLITSNKKSTLIKFTI